MCVMAKCNILSHTRNGYFDSFVLSESSLFVYPYKVMIKTCGTTTLLNAIPKILEFARELELSVRLVMYSRKNFVFPNHQQAPHKDGWLAEVELLNSHFDGSSYILGPITSDHWNLYLADYSEYYGTETGPTENTLEMMMHNLDHSVCHSFYNDREDLADNDKFPGMADILLGSETDEYNFRPCGYSMNGLNKEAYYTIHVTPEPHCSYASFETNVSLPSYRSLINHVLSIFKPGRVTLTFFSEKGENDFVPQNAFETQLEGFYLKHKTVTEMEGNRDVIMCNYESMEFAATTIKKPRIPPSMQSLMY